MLKVDKLNVVIKKKTILKDIAFSINPGSFTVVLGKNGSGKSTLVSCINQVKEYTGDIFFEGQSLRDLPLRERAKRVSILPQVLGNPHILTEDLVKMGRSPYLDIGRHFTAEDEAAVVKGMEVMGIEDLKGCYVDRLSGGERQKVYLAMIIAQDTDLLVLDEPTTYMDVGYQAEFLKTLKQLREKHNKTVVVVMHDLNLAVEYADDIMILEKGQMMFVGTKERCLRECQIEKYFGVQRHIAEDKIFFAI